MVQEDFKNEAFLLYGLDDIRFERYPLPRKPGPNEVLLRSLCTGICGTDLHYWKEMRLGKIPITSVPMVLGHEASAEVVEVGSEVTHLQVGDLVAYEPSNYCMTCANCKNGDYNLCGYPRDRPPYNGSLTYYFTHSADFTFKVPYHVSAEEAALVEPLSIVVHACKRGHITVGSKVFITGAGPIGLLTMITAQAFGATKVVITDINEDRLKLARELGAETILVTKDQSEADLVKRVHAAFGADQLPTVSFECSGVGVNFRLVMLATKSKGTVVFIGMGPTDITLPVADAANREVDIRGCNRAAKGSFETAIDLVASGKLTNLKKLITHRFELKDSRKAFEAALKGEGVKIMIKVGDKK